MPVGRRALHNAGDLPDPPAGLPAELTEIFAALAAALRTA
jgi:hypothetical protein